MNALPLWVRLYVHHTPQYLADMLEDELCDDGDGGLEARSFTDGQRLQLLLAVATPPTDARH